MCLKIWAGRWQHIGRLADGTTYWCENSRRPGAEFISFVLAQGYGHIIYFDPERISTVDSFCDPLRTHGKLVALITESAFRQFWVGRRSVFRCTEIYNTWKRAAATISGELLEITSKTERPQIIITPWKWRIWKRKLCFQMENMDHHLNAWKNMDLVLLQSSAWLQLQASLWSPLPLKRCWHLFQRQACRPFMPTLMLCDPIAGGTRWLFIITCWSTTMCWTLSI